MTTPDIERRKVHPAVVVCIVLLILCAVLGFGCGYFWGEAREAQRNCEALIQAGNSVIDKADDLLGTAGKEIETLSEMDGFRYYADGYKDQFDEFAADTWGKAVKRAH